MVQLLFGFLQTSAACGLGAAFLLLLNPVLRKRYAARWRRRIWLALALFLLIPVHFTLPTASMHVEVPVRFQEAISMSPRGVAPVSAAAEINVAPKAPPLMPREPSHTLPEVLPPTHAALAPIDICVAVWLFGALLFLVYQACTYFFWRRNTRRWNQKIADGTILTLYRQVGKEAGCKKLPKLVYNPRVPSPMVVGLGRKTLLLPQANEASPELAFILRHELNHVKSHDIFWKLVLLLANAAHWFNPLAWCIAAQARHEMEFACDEQVVEKQGVAYRSQYCKVILESMAQKMRHGNSSGFAATFASEKRYMKRRFQNVLDMRPKKRGIAVLAALVLAVALGSSMVIFGTAAPQAPSAPRIPTMSSAPQTSAQSAVAPVAAIQDDLWRYHFAGVNEVSGDTRRAFIYDSLEHDSTDFALPDDFTWLTPKITQYKFAQNGCGLSETAASYTFPAPWRDGQIQFEVTKDAGAHWERSFLDVSADVGKNNICLLQHAFLNERQGYLMFGDMSGTIFIYQTKDGGTSWQKSGQTSRPSGDARPDEERVCCYFVNPNLGFLLYYRENPGRPLLYRTEDGGKTWNEVTDLPSMGNNPNGDPWLFGGMDLRVQDDTLILGFGSNQTWELQSCAYSTTDGYNWKLRLAPNE